MIKKLRLLIAKLALRPPSITLDDLTYVCGIDFKGSLTKMQEEMSNIKATIDNATNLTPESLITIISNSDKISDTQKLKIVEILQTPSQRDNSSSYFG